MKTISSKSRTSQIPAQFDDLARSNPPRVLRSEAEYDRIIAMLDSVLARPALSRGQQAFVETWSILIEDYEAVHHPVASCSGVEALRVLMEERGMNASDLGRLLGNVSLGSKVLRGERELSKAHIRQLAEAFEVDPGVFF
jgi:HTH-type transcriptional regulator/antitoxin HigA